MVNSNAKILIVDDLEDMRYVLKNVLEKEGFKTITSDNGSTAVELVRKELPDTVIMDIKMPEMDGIESMRQMKDIDPVLPVILMTAYGDIETAVQAVKLGAYDYILKPFDNENVVITINNALTELDLKREVKTLRSKLHDKAPLTELMGSSNEIKRIDRQIKCIASTNFTVILYGETGSGKELVARAIHNQSSRREAKFVTVDCGAIPDTLIESELFGYERGAFTGAEKRKEGYFESASKGTLFLDETGNLLKHMQSKLLRALEERLIRRLGGTKDMEIDIRVIVAGNEKLEKLVHNGRFREDLYHRLNEFTIEISPLRERKDDIIYLAKRFLDTTNLELNKHVQGFSDTALECLLNYDWLGNVRELRNVIRRSALMVDDIIEPDNLMIKKSNLNKNLLDLQTNQSYEEKKDVDNGLSLKKIVKRSISDIERRVIIDVLKRTGGNKSKAARILEIDAKTMRHKIREYGIEIKI